MDGWIANCADGSTHVEDWIPGHLSPWQRLMQYCSKNKTWLTGLRMTIGSETVSCPPGAKGYWHSVGLPAVQGVECDEELHRFKGIGYIEGNIIYILWGARHPVTHEVIFWQDQREAEGQIPVIWAPVINNIIPLDAIMEVPRTQSEVKNLKKFTDKILEADG